MDPVYTTEYIHCTRWKRGRSATASFTHFGQHLLIKGTCNVYLFMIASLVSARVGICIITPRINGMLGTEFEPLAPVATLTLDSAFVSAQRAHFLQFVPDGAQLFWFERVLWLEAAAGGPNAISGDWCMAARLAFPEPTVGTACFWDGGWLVCRVYCCRCCY